MLDTAQGPAGRPRHRASPPRRAHPRHRRRAGRLPTAGLLLAAMVAAFGLWWLSTHRTVTLVAGGQVTHHETHAATVAGFLDRAGVQVAPGQEVVPAPSTPLRDGMRIEVVARGGPGLRAGLVAELTHPVALRVVHDGRSADVLTTGRTVAEALADLGVEVGAADLVSPTLDAPVTPGLVVEVARVGTRVEARHDPVPYQVVERPTSRLASGERRVARSGREGRLEIHEQVLLVDGVESERRTLASGLRTGPVSEIVEVGTAAPAPVATVAAAAAPRADPAPSPASAAQASAPPPDQAQGVPANVESGKASWYDNPYGGFTAAHRTLPRGSIVRVVNVANGRSVEVRINDRGPFVPGRVIDLNREAFAQLAPPSRGIIQVRIEW